MVDRWIGGVTAPNAVSVAMPLFAAMVRGSFVLAIRHSSRVRGREPRLAYASEVLAVFPLAQPSRYGCQRIIEIRDDEIVRANLLLVQHRGVGLPSALGDIGAGRRNCCGPYPSLTLQFQAKLSTIRASNHLPISLKFSIDQPTDAAKDLGTGVIALAAELY